MLGNAFVVICRQELCVNVAKIKVKVVEMESESNYSVEINGENFEVVSELGYGDG